MATLSVPQFQTAIIQSGDAAGTSSTDLTISHAVPTPVLTSSHDVLVRVLAVALNPTDHKMPAHFPSPGNRVGCDFCGIVVQHQNPATPLPQFTPLKPGTRVCGGLFPYGRQTGDHATCGAFAQFVVADSRLLIRVPDAWSDLEAAALGGIGWTTAGLALSDPDALNLAGLPSRPAGPAPEEGGPVPVLVYGAAAATGTMACQLLALSGYAPVAVASGPSAALVAAYGARAAAAYTSPTCARDVRDAVAAAGIRAPVRHALDCATTRESAALCFAALHRTGGRYACLEGLPAAWRTRRAVRVREVMAFEGHGRDVVVDDPTYSRAANPALFGLCRRWTAEVQRLVDAGRLRSHPVREVPGAWQGVIDGLATLRKGLVRGEKLAVQISDLG
ncbi:putative alcohol dehydrogenase -like domain-containing protein [Rosellinia necatrix]|uniref:Putative alcohol dehydrogenase-like domain-containing protein n=1 Tax=Rosellinia necatrix TaxID=77044 RepID=A0A1S8ABE4_ROSNE|nr:putative alcohol dehydrogenase -like domain-containing protein [Rosellinia necatrix]